MSKTLRHEYLGWDITVRCAESLRPIDEAGACRRYTASAIATLVSSESRERWADSRAQVLTLGKRSFTSERRCADTLLFEIKELIDALKK